MAKHKPELPAWILCPRCATALVLAGYIYPERGFCCPFCNVTSTIAETIDRWREPSERQIALEKLLEKLHADLPDSPTTLLDLALPAVDVDALLKGSEATLAEINAILARSAVGVGEIVDNLPSTDLDNLAQGLKKPGEHS